MNIDTHGADMSKTVVINYFSYFCKPLTKNHSDELNFSKGC